MAKKLCIFCSKKTKEKNGICYDCYHARLVPSETSKKLCVFCFKESEEELCVSCLAAHLESSKNPQLLCHICSNAAQKKHRCKGCDGALYCSYECKQADKPIHQILCASWANFKTKTPGCIRAIMFGSTEDRPRFIWVKKGEAEGIGARYTTNLIELLAGDEVPVLVSKLCQQTMSGDVVDKSLLNSQVPQDNTEDKYERYYLSKYRLQTQILDRNDMRNKDLVKHQLQMVWNINDKDEKPNTAIRMVIDECKKSDVSSDDVREWRMTQKENGKIFAKQPKEPEVPKPRFPRGNVIFVGLSSGATKWRNANLRDFRNIVDYLRLYRNRYSGLAAPLEYRSRLVRGFRVNCDGDKKVLKRPRVQAVYFPQDHPIFQAAYGDPNGLPQVIIDMPQFKSMRVPKPRKLAQSLPYLENDTLRYMLTNLEAGGRNWGEIDGTRSPSSGSVYLVRADREHISNDLANRLLTMHKMVYERKGPRIDSISRFRGFEAQQRCVDELKEDWSKAWSAHLEALKPKMPELEAELEAAFDAQVADPMEVDTAPTEDAEEEVEGQGLGDAMDEGN